MARPAVAWFEVTKGIAGGIGASQDGGPDVPGFGLTSAFFSDSEGHVAGPSKGAAG